MADAKNLGKSKKTRRLLPTAAEYVRCYMLYGDVNRISEYAGGFGPYMLGMGRDGNHTGKQKKHIAHCPPDTPPQGDQKEAGIIGGSMAEFGWKGRGSDGQIVCI